jgi:hypothetical protein
MNGVATKTTGTGAGDHDAVEDCFADLDAAQSAAIGALDQVPGFLATAALQSSKLRVHVCPTGTYAETWDLGNIIDTAGALLIDGPNAGTFCESTLPGYFATQGSSSAHAGASGITVTQCPENASSDAESEDATDCSCDSGYLANFGKCVAWPETAAASTTAAAAAAADSAGASTPIAVALAAAAAVPLLL